jgi:integrase
VQFKVRKSFDDRLSEVNTRLKAAKIRVRIVKKREKLCLQATLPDRKGGKPYQQQIYLGVNPTLSGLSYAEAKAKEVSAALDQSKFDWNQYISSKQEVVKPPEETVFVSADEWVKRFEENYFTRRERNGKSETTWKGTYMKVFSRFSPEEELTEKSIMRVIHTTKPDSRMRQSACNCLQALANFAGISLDLKPYRGNYSFESVDLRDIPSDELILECYTKIKDKGWAWVFGMMATFGLRNHEVFNCTLEALDIPTLRVEEGKTGARIVFPLPLEWVDHFSLFDKQLPEVTGKANRDFGMRVTKAFHRLEIPFTPYVLRHAWSIRAIRKGMPVQIAARQQGHSLMIHNKVYERFISEQEQNRIYKEMFQKNGN